ncbi:MAG: type II toxin-antitoxin system RelE/ParE family toxin [Balneolaceae bacterium]|nr:type II toxin-antitoxin system RelE/ParE family toxin [Balneolaceae bacterium]
MKIRLLKSASSDIKEGYKFYSTREEGLAEYFKATLFSEIDDLTFQAGIHPIIKGYHRKLTKTFPYAIYYKVTDEEVVISAVLDCRRNPEYLNKKLSE